VIRLDVEPALRTSSPPEYPVLFQYLNDFGMPLFASSLYIVRPAYAQLLNARRINDPPQAAKPEGIYVMERTFKVSSISRHGLDHCDWLNQRGLKSTVEWEGQLSGKRTFRTFGSSKDG
jgi:hypothetical protein